MSFNGFLLTLVCLFTTLPLSAGYARPSECECLNRQGARAKTGGFLLRTMCRNQVNLVKRLDVLPGTPELANVRLICQSKWCKSAEKGTGKKRMVFKGCRYS